MARPRPAGLVAACALAGALAASVVALPAAEATTVVALDDASLAARASLVVVATVAAVEATQHAVGPGVFTDVTLVVERTLGVDVDGAELLTVRMPGGRTDTRAVHIPGMPAFTVGEVVLVFLEPQPDAFDDGLRTWIPVGLEQGVWRPAGVDAWVRTTGHVHHIGAVTSAPEPMTLDAIQTMVGAVGLP